LLPRGSPALLFATRSLEEDPRVSFFSRRKFPEYSLDLSGSVLILYDSYPLAGGFYKETRNIDARAPELTNLFSSPPDLEPADVFRLLPCIVRFFRSQFLT